MSGRELNFGPARDTGMTLGDARRGRGRRRRDPWAVPLIATIAVFLVSAAVLSNLGGASRPDRVTVGGGTSAPVAQALEKMVRPTPVFATYGTLRLHLPVPAEAVTAVAFHQSSFNTAVPMLSLAPTMDLKTASRLAAQKRAAKSATATPAPAEPASAAAAVAVGDVWGGKVIRLWRSGRSGKPETAVDVGASPGTAVIAPVDGTVVYVRKYKLYSKYEDFEVHISPDGVPGVDVVLIHITGVCVAPGDKVEAGITKVACVRKLSKFTALQLADYTADGGDHTHMQVNRTPKPGSIWVSTPAGPVVVPFAGTATETAAPEAADEP